LVKRSIALSILSMVLKSGKDRWYRSAKKIDLNFFVFLWNIKVFLGIFFKHGGILMVNVQH